MRIESEGTRIKSEGQALVPHVHPEPVLMVYLASRRLLKALRALQKWVHTVTKGRASPTKRGHDSKVAIGQGEQGEQSRNLSWS